jgi:hypothetical protein
MSDAPADPKLVLIYVRDLLFASKVVATARAAGVPFRSVRDASVLLQTPAPRLLVDLNADGALETAIAWKQRHGGHVTAFCAHVATDRLQQARAAGLDQVMTNGAFSANLEPILRAAP